MKLESIVAFLDKTFQVEKIQDFPNAYNGLQLANNGQVTQLAGAVDASVQSIEVAIQQGIDFLCVHHGLFWPGIQPMVGPIYDLYRQAIAANLAIYSLHLPLDIHLQYGHNVSIVKQLGLTVEATFAPFMHQPCGLECHACFGLEEITQRLQALFPQSFHAFLFGPKKPERMGIVSGSGGQDLLMEMLKEGIDTLITGEIRYSAVSFAQLHRLNIFACGHYATECFGVKNILQLLQEHTQLPCQFIDTFCEL